MQKELSIKNEIRSMLNKNGGFVDGGMLGFELSDTKVINDLCHKF
jgi:hypothetical protein